MANVLDDGGGQEEDGLGHLGSAQGAAGVGALVAGCTDQVAVGAAVHRAGGGHLKAHSLPTCSPGFPGSFPSFSPALSTPDVL